MIGLLLTDKDKECLVPRLRWCTLARRERMPIFTPQHWLIPGSRLIGDSMKTKVLGKYVFK